MHVFSGATKTIKFNNISIKEKGKMFQFTIIIPIFQQFNIFDLFITSLLKSIEYSTQIILIDDNSPRDVSDKIMELSQNSSKKIYIESLRHEYNCGSSKCINEAIPMIKGKIVAIIDSDTIIYEGWQSIVINTLKDTEIGGIGAVLLYPQTNGVQSCGITYTDGTGRHFMLNASPKNLSNEIYEVQASIFAFFVTTAEVINKVGMLDPSFFNGYEDIDYQMRIRKLGYKIVIHPKLQFYHWEKSNGLHREYNRRSNLGFLWKKHGDFIKEDLWDFIFRQFSTRQIEPSYIGVDLCSSRRDAAAFWENVAKFDAELIIQRIDYSYSVEDAMPIWLLQIIHYDFFRTPEPILFLCDNFVQLLGNDYWLKMREKYSQKDIIVDLYGNVIEFNTLKNHCWPGTKIR